MAKKARSEEQIPRALHQAESGERQRRNQPQGEALAVKKLRQRPMIVAGRFTTGQDCAFEPAQATGEMLKILTLVRQAQTEPPRRGRRFDKNIVMVLGNVDLYQG
jgi:hypothetical protein